MQKRRPQGSGAVLLGGEQHPPTKHRHKIKANAVMIERMALLTWPLRLKREKADG